MKLSLVVPCYNEAENVAAFQDAVISAFDGCGYDYEIIFIDDTVQFDTYKGVKRMCFERFQKMYSISEVEVIIAIGEPKNKILLYNKLNELGYLFANIIHPNTISIHYLFPPFTSSLRISFISSASFTSSIFALPFSRLTFILPLFFSMDILVILASFISISRSVPSVLIL